MAVKDDIPSWSIPSPTNLEMVSVAIQLEAFLLCTYPLTHLRTIVQSLCSYLSKLSADVGTLVVVGDFNFPNIHWPTLQGSCPSSTLLCDTVFECNLLQLVEEPTHILGGVLDLVLTNKAEYLKVHPAADTPFPTDHYLISCGIRLCPVNPSPNSPAMVFDYPKADWNGLSNHLLNQDFSMCYEEVNADIIWAWFKNIVLSAMELFIPKVRLRSMQFPRWYSADLRHQFKCLKSLERNLKVRPSLPNSTRPKQLSGNVQSQLRRVI